MGLFPSHRTQNVYPQGKTVPSTPRCKSAATTEPTRRSRTAPPFLGDMETGSAPDDYKGYNSGVEERGNTAEDDDSDLEEQSAGQHADIGNYLPEYAGLQLREHTENGDKDNEGHVDMTAMMGPQGHRLRETAAPQYGQKEGEPPLEANGK